MIIQSLSGSQGSTSSTSYRKGVANITPLSQSGIAPPEPQVTTTTTKEPTTEPVKEVSFFKRATEEVSDIFRAVKDFSVKFGKRAKQTTKVTDNLIKANFKDTLSLLSRSVADSYQGDNIFGIFNQQAIIDFTPKSLKKAMGDKFDDYGDQLQESALKDLEIIRQYKIENPTDSDLFDKPFFEKVRDPEWVADGLVMTFPSFAASLGVTTIVTAITKNPALGFTAGFGTAFSFEAGNAYRDALDSGLEEQSSRMIGTVVGSINGMLELIFPAKKLEELLGGKVIKRKFFKRLTTIVSDMVVEGGEETVQEIVANAGRIIYDENAELLQNLPESAFFGALMGGISSVGTTTLTQLRSSGAEPNPNIVTEVPGKAEEEIVKKPKTEEKKVEKKVEPKVTKAKDVTKGEMGDIKKYKSAEEFYEGFEPNDIKSAGYWWNESKETVDYNPKVKEVSEMVRSEVMKLDPKAKVYLSGSWPNATARENSDIDFYIRSNILEESDLSKNGYDAFVKTIHPKDHPKVTAYLEVKPVTQPPKGVKKPLAKPKKSAKEVVVIKKVETKGKKKRPKVKAKLVPKAQTPVGEGETKVSRLEARIKNALDTLPEDVKNENLALFKQVNKQENIAKASEYVTNKPEDALRVLTGEIDAPPGILRNSIFIAMQQQNIKDLDIATRLASFQATRAGQELSILTEVNKNSPTNILSDIVRVRTQALEKRYGGRSASSIVKGKAKAGEKMIKPPSKVSWDSIIKEVRC